MVTREDGKHYKLEEFRKSDVKTLMMIETKFAERKREEEEGKGNGGRASKQSPEEIFDKW